MNVIKLPEPPYYAVIAPAELRGLPPDYLERAQHLVTVARTMPGFLGIEASAQPGFSLAVSYWESLDAIAAWRRHAEHGAAKRTAPERWFTAYATRIARVERVY